MNLVLRALLTLVICLVLVPSSLAGKPGARPAPSVTGVFENFTVGKDSGDLEGMRVVIVPAGGGHYAIVQIAQGGAEDPKPEFVPADVKGKTVRFSVNEEKYTATASAAGLTVKDSGGQSQVLKRKACAAYFK